MQDTAAGRRGAGPWAIALGTILIFGGESLCILGPVSYERQIHVVCHAILYGGTLLVLVGAAAHYGAARRRRESGGGSGP